jgi:hypothetical protein
MTPEKLRIVSSLLTSIAITLLAITALVVARQNHSQVQTLRVRVNAHERRLDDIEGNRWSDKDMRWWEFEVREKNPGFVFPDTKEIERARTSKDE